MHLPSHPLYRKFFVLIAWFCLAQLAAAQALPPGVVKAAASEGITEYRLANGLKVLLFPDASKPSVTVNVTYLVGSRMENYGETGMAHLLEHLMFKGTPNHPHLDRDFNLRGMQSNGTTSLDRTNYYEIFQASDANLKWAIEMEADRMIHSLIAKKDLDSEMTVVRNEYENGENSPFSVLMKRMQSVAYDWHSYGKPTIGNRSDIENVKIENLQAFYRMYYQPDNAVLLVAGKFDPAVALRWVAQSFGKIPKPKRRLPVFWTVEPTQDGERSFTVRRNGDVQIVAVGYKVPSSINPDSDALGFAAEILSDTPNGRLHKKLVETGMATQVFSYDMTGYAPGLLILGAMVKKGEPLDPVRNALLETVEGLAQVPPTAQEIVRTRRNDENQIEKMLNDPQQVGVALSDSIALGDWRLFFLDRDRLKDITSQQVAAAASRYLKRDNRTVGRFIPDDQPQRAEIPPAPPLEQVLKEFKAKQKAADAESFDPSQANIMARTQRKQIGGLEVALLPKKTRGETVAVSLSLHWGDEKSLFGKRTVAGLTDAMLARGSRQFTREQLADEFAKLKMEGGLYHFETTRDHLAEALRLVAEVLREPSFPPAEFEQLRRQLVVERESLRNDPHTQAALASARHFNLYPDGDWRTTQTLDQQIAAINAATLDDVKAFYRDFYGASHGELAIVGDFDAAAIEKVIDETLGGWNSALPYSPVLERFAEVPPVRLQLDTPDKENGFFLARQNLDLNDNDPEYPALVLANYIFGEGAGLDSRLMDRIRQKEGLSYGGESSLNAGTLDRAGSFSISAIAAPQNLAKLEASVKDELARAVKQGFSAEEVARAKSGLLQQRAQARARDPSLAQGWTTYLHLKRSFAWSKQFEDKLKALTPEQVNAAFRKAIDPAKLTVAVAGDQAKMGVRK